ncbi:hypothetical protein XELAEV_18033215mg [Xenopus laevis]|uniref:Secreted protein n=1 Tax=Xenopus laevis TaxID=8355 RepID=A0A974CJ61_XENLA|nr:hypothetical protein XELAEV_18033215mg [Xenopus laevis]
MLLALLWFHFLPLVLGLNVEIRWINCITIVHERSAQLYYNWPAFLWRQQENCMFLCTWLSIYVFRIKHISLKLNT